jgi:phosphoglycerate kinase
MAKNSFLDFNFSGLRVFLRADLNVPIDKNGTLHDATKLLAVLPTAKHLAAHGAASIILATHLGRPDPAAPDQALSTSTLLPWLTEHVGPMAFCADFAKPPVAPLVLLENLRFFAGEHQKPAAAFAQQLASMADVYVIDAFGTLHRNDASVAVMPAYFAPKQRLVGLCVEQELKQLARLRNSPAQPFVALLGGSKVADKLALVEHWLTAEPQSRPATILLGGLLGLNLAEQAPELIDLAASAKVTLLLPSDYRYNANGEPIDIGPATTACFVAAIETAKTIFANGTMGKYEEKEAEAGTRATLEAIAASGALRIVGGGDCGAAAHQLGVAAALDFISTGGGATLAYLAAKDPWQELPGLKMLAPQP